MSYHLSANQIANNREYFAPLLSSPSSSSSSDQKVAQVASSSSSFSPSSVPSNSTVSVPMEFLSQLLAQARANQPTATQQSTQRYVASLEVSEGTYEGEVNQERQPHGKGTLTYSNNDPEKRSTYVGDFKNGKPHGTGLMTWRKGATYDGQFVEGIKKGQGTLRYIDDDGDPHEYTGEFDHGQAHGEGVAITTCVGGKKIQKGEFKEGNLWNGTFTAKFPPHYYSYKVVNGDGSCFAQCGCVML